jgi:uncharacterized small protein (DUF1192 family)
MNLEDDRPRKAPTHEIGQDLSPLSIEDIEARIALLTGEIARLEQAKASKQASRSAADSVFKI